MKQTMKKLIVAFIALSFAQGILFFTSDSLNGFLSSGEANAQTTELFYSDSEVPLILPRSVWDNSSSLNALLTWLPQNEEFPSDWQTVDRFIVHDTGCDTSSPSCNNNTNPIATIQSIYRYHAVTRGWGDIGYNYIIDQQGRIYEGRFGGNGSRGAHTYYDRVSDNFNYGSIGIVLLGNYASQDISSVMYDSLSRLIGWLAQVNNLDPQGTKSSLIWNSSVKGFTSSYTGPVVAGHKDVEPGNPDPGIISLVQVKQAAAQYKQKFQGLAYQISNSSKIYQLINGIKKTFDSVTNFLAQGFIYQKLAIISQTQLDIFSESRFLKFSDGSLIQVNSSPSVYLVDDGKKRKLTVTAEQFALLGFDWPSIKKVTQDDLNSCANGYDIIYGPDKDLLSDPDGKVFFIEGGRKRWVTSGGLFNILGFSWKKVKQSTAEYMATILEGDVMTYPSGALVKGTSPTVYLLENSQKREFLSAQSFLRLGYQWNEIVQATDEELARYGTGAFMNYKNGTLVKTEDDPTVYLTAGAQKKSFVSQEHFNNLGYKTSDILLVSADELGHYSFAGSVPYPDGTLVQKIDDFNVYQVVGGLAKLIPDAATFKKLGLSWSKILKIAVNDFNILFASAASAATTSSQSSAESGQSSSTAQTQPNIRVAIWEVPASQTEVVFSASGAYDVYDKNGDLLASKQANEQYSASRNTFAKLVPKSGTILEIVSYEDWAGWKTGLNYNKFRGNLELVTSPKTGKVWVINDLPLEEYLKGVAETNQGMATEYLKTMAVAARTYACHYLNLGGKYGSDEIYHVVNTTADQLYKGYAREPYASDIVAAAQGTYGEMVVYNGQPIVTAYSSGAAELLTSGSRSACSVWGGRYCQAGFEYLNGGVKDPQGTSYSYDACGAGNHCVGLSGAGTRRWAALGKTYKEILTYYYPGTEIKKIY